MTTLTLTPGALTLADCRRIAAGGVRLALVPDAWERIDASAATVAAMAAGDAAVYGVNTGFGKLAQTRIARDQLDTLQRNLVLSHAAGVGEPLAPGVVRLVLALKIASLAHGLSGVRRATVEALIALLNADALPLIPSQGSVGASGDLAPLAHLSAVLLGEGTITLAGAAMPAAAALAKLGLQPLALGPKEGLALLNGTQVSTALALTGLFAAEENFAAALAAGALTTDAVMGSDAPFDSRIHVARGQPGQIAVAQALARLMEGSAIRASHTDCGRVQDPYSIRCQPQVLGACLDVMVSAAAAFQREANGVSDNPLVFAADGAILSGGNFHAEPVALWADALALAVAEIGALAERRIALLIDGALSGLPPFLTADPGLNSGFMIAHVTAAALASENKSLAHPASVDSLPTSANQEDHVSMATFAARRLGPMNRHVAHILGIELLAAAQGIEFRRPLATSPALERLHAAVRRFAPAMATDRLIAPDLAAAAAFVAEGGIRRTLEVPLALPSDGAGGTVTKA